MLLAIVAMTPLLADRVRFMETARSERIAAAGRDAFDLARAGAERQSEIGAATRSVLQAVGHAVERIPVRGRECNRLLADTASDISWIKTLMIADARGDVICSSSLQNLGTRIGDRAYFHKVAHTGGFAVSSPVESRPDADPEVVAAYGKRDATGAVSAIIAASVDIEQLGMLPSLLRRTPNAVTLLVDAGGSVTGAHPDTTGLMGRDLAGTELMQAAQSQSSGAAFAKLDNVSRVWGFALLPNGKGHLFVGLDEQATLQKIEREMTMAYLQLGAAVVLMLLGAWFFGEHTILRPIRALARHAERIGRGDLAVRTTDHQWAAEFGSLARSLDSMAERLRVRENDLRAENTLFKELATIDSLTRLNNRRAFDARIASAWSRGAATRIPVALLMIDVDYFKRFNDHYGHLEGDGCLREVGHALAGLAVEHGWVARYGGEEFVMVLYGVEAADARRIGEEVRRTIAKLEIPHAHSPSGIVTVSVGAAQMVPERGRGPEDLIEAADAALYASKQRRNAVTAYEPRVLAKAG